MLVGRYHPGLVALSVLVAAAAAYVALDLAVRVTASAGRARRLWLAGGAASMGIGIWSMHYIGMLALVLPVPVVYDVPTVLLSLAAAVAASGLALFVVSRDRMTVTALAGGSVTMGCGVAAMHYIGMEAMRFQGAHQYDPRVVALSVVFAVMVSCVALVLAFQLRSESRALAPKKLGHALLMGVAVAGMHYNGMASVTFHPGLPRHHVSSAVSVSALGASGLAVVTFMVLALAVLSSRLDEYLSRQAEAMRRSEDRYRQTFHRSLVGMYLSTSNGELLDCNDALAHMLGFDSNLDMIRHEALELYADPSQRERWLQQLKVQRSVSGFEHQLRRADGRLAWVLESARLVESGADGKPLIEGTIIDITARKDAEERLSNTTATLASSVERYRMLVETTNAVPWEMDGASLRMRYISPQAHRIFGFDIGAIVNGGSVWALLHAEDRDRVRREFAALAASCAPEGLETGYRVVSKSGAIVYVRSVVSASTSPTDASVVLRGITFDVTEQRRLELDLQQAQKLESVGRLAAGVAHEINTPVQFVSDSIHFVRDASDDLSGLIRAYHEAFDAIVAGTPASDALALVAEAEAAADLDYLLANVPKALERSLEGLNRVAVIVRSMKDFAHPDEGAMTELDLNRAIQSTLVIARNEYKYVADVETDLGDLPPVRCHGGEVNQVFLNIIVNAAHAIAEVAENGARGKITIVTRRDDDHAVITISDTGAGVPDAIRHRIFDQFFTTKSVGKGTGQGLAIARSVVHDKHGGRLDCYNEPGSGATFVIRLPIAGRGQPVQGVAA
jgi:PAS domain S-box-containing protein